MKTNFLKTKEDITAWLDKYEVENYSLVKDPIYGFVVNVDSGVDLVKKNLQFIPVKFNTVKNGFYCARNQLTSLEFCPKTVGSNFDCSDNQLTSLDFLPTKVRGFFYCSGNPALGEFQTIQVFSEILRIQAEIERVKKEKEDIGKELGRVEHIDGLPNKSILKI